jgi:predicted hydrocarbon binding protein
MHGIVGYELYDWIRANYGDRVLLQILSTASTKPIAFVVMMSYDDEDFFAFIAGAADVVKKPAPALLHEFGRHIAPQLVKAHKDIIPDHWRALDVIEHTERTIHSVVRRKDAGATPPRIRAERRNGEVRVIYDSPRRICQFGKGLIEGIGLHYKQPLTVQEPSCMHQGSPYCEFVVAEASGA